MTSYCINLLASVLDVFQSTASAYSKEEEIHQRSNIIPRRRKIKPDRACIVDNIADLIILAATCSARRRGYERWGGGGERDGKKRRIPNKPELASPAEILEPNAKQNLKTVNRLRNIIVIFFPLFPPITSVIFRDFFSMHIHLCFLWCKISGAVLGRLVSVL